MTHPGLRASDDDRRRVVAELERHTTEGRLTLDEFSDRVGLVYSATTHGELARVIHDLPAAPRPVKPAATEQRHLLIALLLAAVTIAALGIVLAMFK